MLGPHGMLISWVAEWLFIAFGRKFTLLCPRWYQAMLMVILLLSKCRQEQEDENVPSWDHTIDYRAWKLVITGMPSTTPLDVVFALHCILFCCSAASSNVPHV